MPLYFYANSDSKDCYRMSITGKLFANMLKTAGVDSVIILDSPTPQLEGFFDMNVDNLKASKKYLKKLIYKLLNKIEFRKIIKYNAKINYLSD